jgi:hypothetical protein
MLRKKEGLLLSIRVWYVVNVTMPFEILKDRYFGLRNLNFAAVGRKVHMFSQDYVIHESPTGGPRRDSRVHPLCVINQLECGFSLTEVGFIYFIQLRHVDPLLSNDREISKYTTAVTE